LLAGANERRDLVAERFLEPLREALLPRRGAARARGEDHVAARDERLDVFEPERRERLAQRVLRDDVSADVEPTQERDVARHQASRASSRSRIGGTRSRRSSRSAGSWYQ